MINYKESEAQNWFYFIDDLGNKGQSWSKKNRPKMYAEMMTWVAEGNKIEPRYTAEELAEKEATDLVNAIESQKSTCIQLLNDSERAVSNDPPYPNDIEAWKTFRASIRIILKSDKPEAIPKKPF